MHILKKNQSGRSEKYIGGDPDDMVRRGSGCLTAARQMLGSGEGGGDGEMQANLRDIQDLKSVDVMAVWVWLVNYVEGTEMTPVFLADCIPG